MSGCLEKARNLISYIANFFLLLRRGAWKKKTCFCAQVLSVEDIVKDFHCALFLIV